MVCLFGLQRDSNFLSMDIDLQAKFVFQITHLIQHIPFQIYFMLIKSEIMLNSCGRESQEM